MIEFEHIVDIAVRNVPQYLKEDAKQAGYVGLLDGLRRDHEGISNLPGYLYRCVTNEIIREYGRLHQPFSLNSKIMSELLKYKHLRQFNDIDLSNVSSITINELERLASTKQRSLPFNEQA